SAAGGGLCDVSNGAISLSNCTLSGNSASQGGGMAASTLNVTLTNCTISKNSATNGGGLLNQEGALALVNTIAVENTNGDVVGGYTDGGANLTSGILHLAPLGDYGGPTLTMALLPGSPAIGAGMSGPGIPAVDERGQPRKSPVDIGAFQSQGFTLT